jgi:hypothetical protein
VDDFELGSEGVWRRKIMANPIYKVGQKVKVLSVENNPWQSFMLDDKDRLLNQIFKITKKLNLGGYQLETPYGRFVFDQRQFRHLKKKGEGVRENLPADVKPITLKGEMSWLDKIQQNFKDAGEIPSSDTGGFFGRIGRIPSPQAIRVSLDDAIRRDGVAQMVVEANRRLDAPMDEMLGDVPWEPERNDSNG